MGFKIKHFDDGKEKWQSHEVSIKGSNDGQDLYIVGFGETKEQAYHECMEKLESYINSLMELLNKMKYI